MKNFRTTPHRSTVAAESAARQIALSMTRGRVNGLAAGLVTGLVAGLSLLSPTLAQAVERIAALGLEHPDSVGDVALMNGFLTTCSDRRGIVR